MFTRKKVFFLVLMALLVGRADGAELITAAFDQRTAEVPGLVCCFLFYVVAWVGVFIRSEQEDHWYMQDLRDKLKAEGSGLHG